MGGMGLKVGVYGGSGYAGIELVRLLAGHPEVGATSVASRGSVGLRMGDVYPQLAVDGVYVAPVEIGAPPGNRPLCGFPLARGGAIRGVVRGASCARASRGGALRVARGLRSC